MEQKKVRPPGAIYIGVDPGKSGGVAVLNETGVVVKTMAFNKGTEREVSDFFREWRDFEYAFCLIERVHSMPRQGVKSMFTFGQSYGFLRACLICYRIKFVEIPPKEWMKKLGCMSGGDKKVTRAKAQQLFPRTENKITHSIADALLLAWSAREYMK